MRNLKLLRKNNRNTVRILLAAFLCSLGSAAQSGEVIYPWVPYAFHTTITGSAYGVLDVGHEDGPVSYTYIPKDQSTNDVGTLWGNLATNSIYSPVSLSTNSRTYQPYYTCEDPSCSTGYTRTNQFHYSIKVSAQTQASGLETNIMGSSELSFDRGLDPKQPWFRAAGPEIKQEGGSELTFHFNSAADPDYVSAEVYWFGTLHSEWEKDAGGGELNLESWAGIVAIDEDGTRTDKVDLKYTDVQGSGKTAKSFSFFEYVNGDGSISLTQSSRVTLDTFNSVRGGGTGFDDAAWSTSIDHFYLVVRYNYKSKPSVDAFYGLDGSGSAGEGAWQITYGGMPVQLPVPEPSSATLMILGIFLLVTRRNSEGRKLACRRSANGVWPSRLVRSYGESPF